MILTLSPGQDLRCNLVSDKCLDVTLEENRTIQVPINTTRLVEDGLTICLSDEKTQVTPVDIVFVVDQSASMSLRDSSYAMPGATRSAITLLRRLSPSSTVGIIPFSLETCSEHAPISIQSDANYQRLLNIVATELADGTNSTTQPQNPWIPNFPFGPWIDAMGTNLECRAVSPNIGREKAGTAYRPPLEKAHEFLKESPHSVKAVIMLTDGHPDDNGESDGWINSPNFPNDFPPVHSIFIGGPKSGEDAERLIYLGDKTGGAYHPIPVNDTAALNQIFLEIVQYVTGPEPMSTAVKNLTNGQSSQSVSYNNIPGQSGSRVILDQLIGLNAGSNTLQVTSTSIKDGITQPATTTTLTVVANGPAAVVKGSNPLSDSLFNLNCMDKSLIKTYSSDFQNPITAISEDASDFGISLISPSANSSPEVKLSTQKSQDVETGLLTSATNGGPVKSYQRTARFAVTPAAGNPGNNAIEGQKGDIIQIAWAHPRDPRDNASASLPVQFTEFYFADINGNPISSLSNITSTQFKLIAVDNRGRDSLGVQLGSSDGDALSLWLKPTAGGAYEAAVNFQFVRAVNSANKVIEGKLNPSELAKTLLTALLDLKTAQLTLESGLVPVAGVWIEDVDGDGRAETVFIQYKFAPNAPPGSVTGIGWPSGNSPKQDVTAATPGAIAFQEGSGNIIVRVPLPKPFPFGATSPSLDNPPTLILPGGAQYQIEDGVKPIILAVEKEPSTGHYMLQDDEGNRTPGLFPNKVTITLSEPVRIPPNSGEAPWNTLFQYMPAEGGKPLPLISKTPPTISEDSLTWVLMAPEVAGGRGMQAGDSVYFNPASGATDKKGNTLNDYKVESEGADFQSLGTDVYLVEAIIGKSSDMLYEDAPIQGESVPVVDKNGTVIGYERPIVERRKWIPPSTLVNPLCAGTAAESQELVEYPANCLSSILVLTSEAYTAEVSIFSHLGHIVHNSKQVFGNCGELNNPRRKHVTGKIISYLIWNQKDLNGKFVGSGVYLWKIKLNFTGGNGRTVIKKQGIIRNAQYPDATCTTQH